ncbi:thiol-disulfide isomerase/thioredoxin [Corynebacterium kroppenstedtii DSM 44385]|uniref:Thiol-disulfide isomerase/thioredoxin n=1 Tax=Corynebacterium kroppenstedtii (strain DSM 44385 / JCM 11950 / CIP 105744 / CCUG 35717) TaxID=645127 RepID=C4LLB3_CORK4|nr:thiol-disulfide isomerase/thioredoxin [Corynebacterium kroppenstedtii DSM 44385]
MVKKTTSASPKVAAHGGASVDTSARPRKVTHRHGWVLSVRHSVASALVACAIAAVGATTLTACGSDETAGKDAVAVGGNFSFVSPGGQLVIKYDQKDRKPVKDLSGPSLMESDKTIKLSDFDNQIVVLNAWGQWCAPCRTEVDDLQEIQDDLQKGPGNGADGSDDSGTSKGGPAGTVLGINVRDFNKQAAQDFVKDNDITYPSIYDPSFKSAISLGGIPASVVPTTIVLDKQHRPAAVFLREVNAKEIMDVVNDLEKE